ncbi:bypass of stop codon protein, putative [Aspergillus oryzae 100-8]|uniref:Bypass of stop codon protein, putative n=1 Tax=Aspergillus oryzae (strain 3.042) TaxID=1160506 RepID=I8TPK6_ASPO3|nr:bypass of stop codon protein, putative [Aspergillus oryzae 3.042]KDE76353.1 bypass of stop codon protein, putative [Aspergillus oryzae 100-8]|eukprot:EIT76160.1 bypass of stop codon protein, putative [Aspergillus oryzae 3.042]
MKPDTGCLEPINELARQPSITESREDVNERLAKPNKWNHPRSNIIRVLTTFWVFFVMGANDAAYGAILPYLEEYYNIPYMIVSLVFLSPLVGYVLAALVNNKLHMALGQRGVALIAPACHFIAYIISCIHPPYPALVVAYIFAGIANGLHEAAWNTYIGSLDNPNELLGLLHGVYGLGAVISPLVATNMITKAKVPWYYFYFFMVGAAFRQSHEQSDEESGDEAKNGLRDALFTRPAARVSWLSSFVLLFYVGVEVTVGGWIVTIMMEVRHAAPFPSGMTATGFWLGITAGRVVLGFVTARLGEKLSVQIYISCAIVCALIVWLVPNFYVSAVVVSIQGFFLGPLFPCVVAVITKLLPKHLHVAAVGFVAAFGGAGAAVLPFVAGGIAQGTGVKSLLPFVVGVSAGILLLWLGLPRQKKSGAQQ